MSDLIRLRRARRAGIAVALAFAAIPAAAQAAAVDLGTVSPFVVLGGSAVTNTGPSVLNGDLGVSPGTSLTGFGLPAVVNGAIHNNDAVAAQAQADLTTAYDVAAGQPVAPADDLSGTDLGNRTLTAGAYRYTSDAQLTGPLTLDAQGDPNAQFVFEIASALTTAPASSVLLINGASPCNVYWQVGSSATLDTTTAFQGNLMALTDISLNDAATVTGRMLARNGQVSLINNVLNRPQCATGSTTTPTPTSPGTTTPGAGSPTAGTPAQVRARARARARADRRGQARITRTARSSCTDGFVATVRGKRIARASFSLDGRPIVSRGRAPFRALMPATPGAHRVRVHVTFTDRTRAKNLTMRYRACAAQLLQPRRGPSRFTG